MSNAIVKNVTFGNDARTKILEGVKTLAEAVTSTLGPSGMRVLLEDKQGNPVITKDGVSVAEEIVLLDPIENMGATLVKQAARKTVKTAGDGTTTATSLAYAILREFSEAADQYTIRDLQSGMSAAVEKVIKYLEYNSIDIDNPDVLDSVATISANNDPLLGKIIADAFKAVDIKGVVALELTEEEETTFEVSDGAVLELGLTSPHFITNKGSRTAELENPYVLLMNNKLESLQTIIPILEVVVENNASLLIVADVDPKVLNTLAVNKIQNNMKINVVDAPAHGPFRSDRFEELAAITGATVLDEKLGDDLNLIQLEHLGRCEKTTTSNGETIIKPVEEGQAEVEEIVSSTEAKLRDTKNPIEVTRLEQRLAVLNGKAATVKVGAPSEVERKETFDRVEDAICATKAAVKGGILPGGGAALISAYFNVEAEDEIELLLFNAIRAPFITILGNAGIDADINDMPFGQGINAITGEQVDMLEDGVIDPTLVTVNALRNAASVASTILSTNCTINNLRIEDYESTRG